jgi:hypothetical protein
MVDLEKEARAFFRLTDRHMEVLLQEGRRPIAELVH